MADKIRFDGRVAIVTGAGAGLGRAYALELARRGAKVVVNDLGLASATADTETSSKAADAVVAEIKAAGGVAVANYDSVATWEGGNNIVKTALDNFGKLDILINNAGFVRDRSFLKMAPEDFDAVLKVNNYGAFNVTKHAVVAMKENGYGRIVNTASAAIFGSFGQANYDTAKAGMVGFTHNLALELDKYGILSNAICPMGLTRMTANSLPGNMHEWMKPEAIAVTVAYLCSEECTNNGFTIHATGPVLNRVAFFATQPVVVGNTQLPTVEDVRDSWSKVIDLEGASMVDFRENHITAGIFEKISDMIG